MYRNQKQAINLSPVQNNQMNIQDNNESLKKFNRYFQNLDSHMGIRNTHKYLYEDLTSNKY